MEHLVQTMHLSCTDANTTSKRKSREIPHDSRHQGAPSDACKMISEPMLRSTQIVHLSCVKISTISKRTETSFQFSLVTQWYHRMRQEVRFHMTHVTLELHRGRPKEMSEPMVRSTQTMHLSCVKISTIFERTEMSFHLSLIT